MAGPRTPAPISTPISDKDMRGQFTGYVPTAWSDYFNGLDSQLEQSFTVLQSVTVPVSSVSIGVTPISNIILTAGLYRVSYYVVETQADNVGSSLTIGIAWTDRNVSRFLNGAALTGNSINVAQSNTYLLRIDRATPITYQVAYSSTGGSPKMIYSLDIALEQVLVLP